MVASHERCARNAWPFETVNESAAIVTVPLFLAFGCCSKKAPDFVIEFSIAIPRILNQRSHGVCCHESGVQISINLLV